MCLWLDNSMAHSIMHIFLNYCAMVNNHDVRVLYYKWMTSRNGAVEEFVEKGFTFEDATILCLAV